MAVLSDEAKNFIKEHRKALQNNDLKSIYVDLVYAGSDIYLEVSEFLYETLGTKIFKYLSTIPGAFLANSKSIKDISIPDNISAIGNSAFKNSSIQSVSLNQGVEVIGISAFENCKNLKHVDLGAVKVIKSEAFANCPNLRQLYLPESVTMLGKNVFPDNIIIKSPKRKAKSLRFPKNELEWYRTHLMVDSSQSEEEGEE